MTRAKWYCSEYAKDSWLATQDPTPENGDGRIYIVRDIFNFYISARMNGWMAMTENKAKAKRFYCGQAAWGAATKSIYPAEVLVIGRVKKK